jgi:transposase
MKGNLPELQISQILFIGAGQLHIEALPVDLKQNCPCCKTDQAVIGKGKNGMRRVRHLSVFEKQT